MRKMDLRPISALLLAVMVVVMPQMSLAQAEVAETASDYAIPSLTGNFKSAYVMDAETGLTLVATNPDDRRQPASMLKMMTELIILEHIADGDLRLDEIVKVSAKASRMGGSQVYLKHGEEFTVEELLKALAIHSANDAAVALAEHLAGSTDAFIDLMNMRAGELGMRDSEFHSVHGLPAGRGQSPDMTTARDLARLGMEIIKYPQALEWASTKTAPFRDGKFTLYNPNKLVGNYRGLDGIKTGYTGAAGFCVTASATQKGKRLISVVMGCPKDKDRANETTRLLTYGFNAYTQVAVIKQPGEILPEPIPVKDGKVKTARIAYGESLTVSVPRNQEADLRVELLLPEAVQAPQALGAEVGRAVVKLGGRSLGSVPLILTEELVKGSWWDRFLN